MKRNARKTLAETILLTLAIPLTGYLLNPDDPLFTKVNPNPIWVPVLLISIRFGNPYAFLAGVIAAACHLVFIAKSGFNFVEAFQLGSQSIIDPLLYPLISGLIGEEAHKYLKRQLFLQKNLSETRSSLQTSEEERGKLAASYRQVEGRLAGASDTLLNLHDNLISLKKLDGEDLYRGILAIINNFLNAKKAGIWFMDKKNKWHCLKQGELLAQDLPALGAIALKQKHTVSAQECFARGTAKPEAGILAGVIPDCFSAKLAVLVVQETNFRDYNPNTIHMFDLIIEWVTQTISINKLLKQATGDLLHAEAYGLASEHFFRTSIKKELAMDERREELSTLLLVALDPAITAKVRRKLNIVLAACLRHLLRRSDTAAYLPQTNGFALLLPLTTKEQAEVPIKKIRKTFHSFNICLYPDKKQAELYFKTIILKPEININQLGNENLQNSKEAET